MSICPICKKRVPVERYQEGDKIYDRKICPEHGIFKTLVWEGEPSYKDWNLTPDNVKPQGVKTETVEGCPYDCGLCENHKQEACCVLIELTNRCNQHCSFCFANAQSSHQNISDRTYCESQELTIEEIKEIYEFLLEQSPDRPFNIQLSGGEPTIRKDLPEIIAMGREMGFPYIQLNTNGRKLADSREYVRTLKQAGLSSVFLQFDGLKDDIYLKTRGERLLDKKIKAIEHCICEQLGTVLVVTVVPKVNEDHIGEIIEFAIKKTPYLRGIHFQPVSYFGRFPGMPEMPGDDDRITIPKLIRNIELQTGGKVKKEAFVPLMTGHPLCSFHGNFIVGPDKSLTSLSDQSKRSCLCSKDTSIIRARNYIARKWSWQAYKKPLAESTEYNFSEWDDYIQNLKSNSFSITAMAFQDAWNLDLKRLERCRVHVATRDKRLIPFCAYNIIHREKNQ
ncbi:MAG: radical SAM protein [Eubacteriales bacterium]|nr:radical SAM protein [Eubacteriales bacterium]MDD4583308.1 radical SAM protein [Eubacteriales bacterium]